MIMFNDVNENSRTVLHSSFIIMPCLNRVCVYVGIKLPHTLMVDFMCKKHLKHILTYQFNHSVWCKLFIPLNISILYPIPTDKLNRIM